MNFIFPNWSRHENLGNRSFFIDLSERYKRHGTANYDEFKAYLCLELLGTCDSDSESKGEEYRQKAAVILGILNSGGDSTNA